MNFPVLRSRITPPDPPAARPRVLQVIGSAAGERRVALVAGPGYGKTLAAAQWARSQNLPMAWLSLADPEDDPHSLLCYLRATWLQACPELDTATLDGLLRQGLPEGRWRAAADALWVALGEQKTNFCWILDDAHYLVGESLAVVDYLCRYLPDTITAVFTCRQLPKIAKLTVVDATLLALTPAEMAELGLDGPEVWEKTRGWPLAVDWWKDHGPVVSEHLLEDLWSALDASQQSLLMRTSVLESLEPHSCKELCPELSTAALLEQLRQQGVFVQPWGAGLRVHPFFRQFLQDKLKQNQALSLATHRAAAPLALRSGNADVAVHHLLASQSPGEAAHLLLCEAQQMLESGSYRRLSQWVESLPAEVVDAELQLVYARALQGVHHYDRALQSYQLASHSSDHEVHSQALLGLARLFVDTLQPRKAQDYLRQAYRALDPSKRGEVLQLFAENYLNLGRSHQAERFRRWAQKDGPARADSSFEVRALLRTGQLHQARACLQQSPRGAEGHRENQLILAYIEALEGQALAAEQLSRSSLALSQRQESNYSQAVAWMRLGHALQLQEKMDEARGCYSTATALAEGLGAPRLKAEAMMGGSLLSTAEGDWVRSYQLALDALELTREAGDEWLSAWLLLTSAIAARQGLHPEANNLLQSARSELLGVHDRFGVVLCELWLAMDRPAALETASQRCRDLGYGFLLERATFFGPRLPAQPERPASLRISILGPLQVSRGGQEVPQKAWKRKKAKELLGLLVSLRGGSISKEQLWEILFPDSSPEAAARDLRVILHAMFEVLDPDRPHNSPARCVVRRDDHYSLPWNDELSLDLADFEKTLEHSQELQDPDQAIQLLQRAHNLVRGDCLEEFPYAEWAQALRTRWKDQYLRSASRLAQLHLQRGHTEKALEVAHQILGRDRCWEEGYRILMRVHIEQGRMAQAAQVYDMCSEVLKAELGVEPGTETEALFASCL